MNTIIAAFCDSATAQQALQYIHSRGVTDAELLTHGGGTTDRLRDFHIPDDKAGLYAEVMRRGAPVLVAHSDNDDAREIASELDRMGSLDLDAASSRWRQAGWNGYDESSLPYDAAACAGEQQQLRQESMPEAARPDVAATDTRDIDVIEEKVNIGTRAVERGAVRVRTYVVERPVHESVELHEERIDVTREPVNERVSPAAMDSTLRDEEFVLTAQGEEAVVGKEARVVERVHVGKVAETRRETIDETERRQEVEVEPIGTAHADSDEGRRRP